MRRHMLSGKCSLTLILCLVLSYSAFSQDITEEYLKGKWISFKRCRTDGDSLSFMGTPYYPREEVFDFVTESLFFIHDNNNVNSPLLYKYLLVKPYLLLGQRTWKIFYIDEDRFYLDAVHKGYPPSMLERSYYIRLEKAPPGLAKANSKFSYPESFTIDKSIWWERYKTVELFTDYRTLSRKTVTNNADTLVFVDSARLMIYRGLPSPKTTVYRKYLMYFQWLKRTYRYFWINADYFALDEIDLLQSERPTFRYYYRKIRNGGDFLIPSPEPDNPIIIKEDYELLQEPAPVMEGNDTLSEIFSNQDDITGWWVKYKTSSLRNDTLDFENRTLINIIDTLVFVDSVKLMIYNGLPFPYTTEYQKFLMFLLWPQHSYYYRRIDSDHFLLDEMDIEGINPPQYRFYYMRITK